MTHAMILCAGFGTRMQDLTKNTPKPMLPVGDKPILEHTITHLEKLGIKNIVINLHYLSNQITSYFGNGDKWGVKIFYKYEESPLGTAGAVKNVQNILSEAENFLVLYGDIVTNQNYRDLFNFHKTNNNAIGTIILHERSKSNSIVEMDDAQKIIKFVERPSEDEIKVKKQNWVNSGLYCFNRKIFDIIPENNSNIVDFPKHIFPQLIETGCLYGFPLTGYRSAIDSSDRYFMVQSDYKNRLIFGGGLDEK